MAYPEQAEEYGRREIPLAVQQDGKAGEQEAVPDRLFCVLRVATLVESLGLDLLVQRAIVGDDCLLRLDVDRGVVSEAFLSLALFLLGAISLPVCTLPIGGGGGGWFGFEHGDLV